MKGNVEKKENLFHVLYLFPFELRRHTLKEKIKNKSWGQN